MALGDCELMDRVRAGKAGAVDGSRRPVRMVVSSVVNRFQSVNRSPLCDTDG